LNGLFAAALALLVDRVVGDPTWLPHPVVIMGKYIRTFERRANHWARGSASGLRWRGVALTLTTTCGAALVTAFIGWAARQVSPAFGTFVNIWLISTTIAWKGLAQAGKDVHQALSSNGLDAGRRAVGMIVGRDTETMSETDVVRATVETLAENIVDAIVAPVLFAALGGAPLAMFYRAANTLDAMVGYKNERFQHFGWGSARLDDVLNYVPARVTVCLMYLALCVRHRPALSAWRVMRRDAHKHPSPNSGLPEAMMAGGLSVQLGGWNLYGGIPSFRAHLGDAVKPLVSECIPEAVEVVNDTAWILLSLVTLGGGAIWFFITDF
jgi:adenosylcobinamide-phosphate synthase